MALATLAALKTELGVTDTSKDVILTQMLGAASDAIRDYMHQFLGGVIGGISKANPAVCECPGHNLQSGDSITIGGSDSSPAVDGVQPVTVIDNNSFSVPVDTSSGATGTIAYFAKTFTEYYDGNGRDRFQLRQTPVWSIASLYLDDTGYYGQGTNAFAASTQLLEGSDFVLKRDLQNQNEKSVSGEVLRINGVWDNRRVREWGRLVGHPEKAMGNIKATYTAGWSRLPARIQLATWEMVAIIKNMSRLGSALSEESYDYYSYKLAPEADQANAFGTVRQILGGSKRQLW